MRRKDFERYFKAMYMPLGMYALRIVEDVAVAEDLVQNAFLKTWERIDDVEDFRRWMYRCVRNECLDYLRGRHDFVGLDELPDVGEEDIDTSERDALIWRAIDALPPKCREVFLLSKRDGLSGEEIAEAMDISVKTVRNQMTKALSRLRAVLDDGHKPFFLPFL